MNYQLFSKSNRPINLIVIGLIINSFLYILMGYLIWSEYQGFTEVATTELTLQRYSDEIIYFDEILTMSARMAVSTGDLKWEKRYYTFEPKLDEVIKKTIELVPGSIDKSGVQETNHANLELIKMELQSFELIHQGKIDEAQSILFSDDYEKYKQIYSTGIMDVINSINERIEFTLEAHRIRLFIGGLLSIISLPILILIWSLILYWIKKHLKDEEEEKAAQFSHIFEESSNEIYLFDALTLKFIEVNRGAMNNLGYTLEELQDITPLELKPDFSLESFKKVLEPLRNGEKKLIVFETVHERKDHSYYDVEVHLQHMKHQGDDIFVAIILDITERKEAEKEKLELHERLEQSERMESLGLLAGGVAHDLNNIIGPIMAYPELIRMDLAAGKPIDKDLDTIVHSAQRAADVIADLLALTRRGNYEMVSLDLNDLINDYLSSAEYKTLKSLNPEVEPNIQLSDQKLLFKGSQAHLPKVILNLVNNACESMPKGGVLSITTSTIKVVDDELSDKGIDDGIYQLLTMEDQGEGIPQENIAKLFDPFFTTKIKTGKSGTGLGLSVVYNVLMDHGAHIDVESKLGIGTKFSIYFTETTEKIKTTKKEKQLVKGNGSILVIDDRKAQREIATRVLTTLGYEVESVKNGKDAVGYIKKNKTDLLWLDMILEDEMDGLEVYKEIIKIKPNQKAIIVSGYSETDRVKEAEELGVIGFVQKPYKFNEIGLTIEKALNN